MQPPQPAEPAADGSGRRRLTRREVLLAGTGVLGVAGIGVLSAGTAATAKPVGPGSQVRELEANRARSGRTVDLVRTAQVADVDLGGGQIVSTWVYNGQLPGPEIRVRRGDVLRLQLVNQLPDPTGIHWHGLAIRNDMDGVPGTTMPLIGPGAGFAYDFVVPDAGTYWYHSHVGLQLDRGLYGALVVDDPAEPARYDLDTSLVFDDWLDGLGQSPQAVYDTLRRTGMTLGSGGMSMPAAGTSVPSSLGGDAGDVRYPLLLVNGKNPLEPTMVLARPGQRVRLRLINAGADTAFRVAVGGHRMTVTHADGYPVRPVIVDTLLIGMGERYDVLVTAGDGVFPIVGYAGGKGGTALALLQTSAGARPPAGPPSAPADRPHAHLQRPASHQRHRARPPARQQNTASRVEFRRRRLPVDDQRTDLQQQQGPSGTGRPAGTALVPQRHNDVSPDAPARPHIRRTAANRTGNPQGHRSRQADADNHRRVRRSQPGAVGAALPQRLPPGGRHDDQPVLCGLTRGHRKRQARLTRLQVLRVPAFGSGRQRGRSRVPGRGAVSVSTGPRLPSEREQKASVGIASTESFSGWGRTFTDPGLCAAIVDRLTFAGHIIETGTDSYRLVHSGHTRRVDRASRSSASQRLSSRSGRRTRLTTLSRGWVHR